MEQQQLFDRYQDVQKYVGWTAEDAGRIIAMASLVVPHIPELVDDFYAEIERHPSADKVITGGKFQVQRLKGTLQNWLLQLFA